MTELNQKLADLRRADEEFFDRAFTNAETGAKYVMPDDIKKAAISICRSYGIRGICDPMYIANVIAAATGRGDGCSHFYPESRDVKIGHVTRLANGRRTYSISADSDSFAEVSHAQGRVNWMIESRKLPTDEFAVVERIVRTHSKEAL